MSPEWEAIWTFINIVGWPTALLMLHFRGVWVSGRHAERERIQIMEQCEAMLDERDKKYLDMNDLWRERYKEVVLAREEWKGAAQGFYRLTDRAADAAERAVTLAHTEHR